MTALPTLTTRQVLHRLEHLPLLLLLVATPTAALHAAERAPNRTLAAEQQQQRQLYEQGRWAPWGNGVRIDYSDGWSDAILTGPAGPEQWSWAPGASRLDPPSNVGKAVQLSGAVAAAVGVYRIQPAQADQPLTTVSLMSNGLAFNAIDALAGGTWRLDNGEVEITWSSGWLTRFEPRAQGPLQVRIWEPARRHPSPPTAIRPGQRLEAPTP